MKKLEVERESERERWMGVGEIEMKTIRSVEQHRRVNTEQREREWKTEKGSGQTGGTHKKWEENKWMGKSVQDIVHKCGITACSRASSLEHENGRKNRMFGWLIMRVVKVICVHIIVHKWMSSQWVMQKQSKWIKLLATAKPFLLFAHTHIHIHS